MPDKLRGNPYALGHFTDEWGCTFENIQPGVIGEVKQPLLDDWSKLDELQPPNEMLTLDVAAVDAGCRANDKFLMAACCPRPFERMQFLRGTREPLHRPGLGPNQPGAAPPPARASTSSTSRARAVGADRRRRDLMFMDDWGSQTRCSSHPDLWREIFKPLYADYCASSTPPASSSSSTPTATSSTSTTT